MQAAKEALLSAMEAYFGDDSRRINHARRVTEYAEQIMAQEGGDYVVVIGAAVLHDIGIPQAEKKYGSAGGKYQEIEGPPIARELLSSLKFDPAHIDEICEIIAHHHSPGKINTANFKVLYDADWLVNLKNDLDIQDRDKLTGVIDRVFLTEAGRSLARKTYLSKM
jgi:HD superfamily phosphodiesterase